MNDNTIHIYTDGSCSGNPGPGGVGVVLIYKSVTKEISKPIGETTNNRAELTAVLVGLQALKHYDYPVQIYTDSSYVINVLTEKWHAKTNIDLIGEINAILDNLEVGFNHVKGHSGNVHQERTDELAKAATRKSMNEEMAHSIRTMTL
jgi:ribonuclease HI